MSSSPEPAIRSLNHPSRILEEPDWSPFEIAAQDVEVGPGDGETGPVPEPEAETEPEAVEVSPRDEILSLVYDYFDTNLPQADRNDAENTLRGILRGFDSGR